MSTEHVVSTSTYSFDAQSTSTPYDPRLTHFRIQVTSLLKVKPTNINCNLWGVVTVHSLLNNFDHASFPGGELAFSLMKN